MGNHQAKHGLFKAHNTGLHKPSSRHPEGTADTSPPKVMAALTTLLTTLRVVYSQQVGQLKSVFFHVITN
jgi:hypothetical protein